MHFPVPMPAFDVHCIDSPYQAVGEWQNRFFAVPPAMGIDYRDHQRLRLHLGQPGHGPREDRRARRVLPAPRGLLLRALGRDLREVEEEDGGPDRGDHRPPGPGPPGVRAGRADARGRPEHRVLRAPLRVRPHAALRRPDVAAPLRAAAPRLRRLRHLLGLLQDQPPRHPRPAHRADGRRDRRAPVQAERGAPPAGEARDRQRRGRGVRRGALTGGDRRRARAERRRARPGSRSSRRSRTRGSTWPPATASTTTTAAGTTTRRSPTRRSSATCARCNEGEEAERPTEELARERERLAEEYGALLDEETRGTFNELLGLSRMVFPYVEEHKFYCDYWFLTRWWNKVREFGALLAKHGFLEDTEDVFQLGRHEVAQALDELLLTWATGGAPLGPKHWPPIVARRKELLERLADWTPPPAIGATPEAITDPMSIMLWGVTTQRVQEWASAEEGGGRLTGAAASPGVVEGVARVVIDVEQIAAVRDGDVLVCPITSPAWAPIFSSVRAVVTDIGGVMSHAAIVCREYGLPAVVGTGPRDGGDPDGADGPRRRLERRRDDPRRVSAWTRRLHPPARGAAAIGRRASSAARARTWATCSRPGSRFRPGSRSSAGAFRAFVEETGLDGMIASALSRALEGRRGGGRRRLEDDRRGDALRAAAGGCCETSSPGATKRWGSRRRWPSARARSARTAMTRRFAGQQESFLWVRGVEQLCDAVRDCWVSLYTAARDQLPRRARDADRAGDGRDRPADGRRRGLGRDVHLQPGQRRPEHGRAQRELGARDRGRRRRDDPGRLPRQQGHRRGRAPDREREGDRVRAGRRRARHGAAWRCRRIGARSRASTRPARRARRGRAGASSATSARTRTSSGRSRAAGRSRSRCSCSSRVR